jgi:hypothetical protein
VKSQTVLTARQDVDASLRGVHQMAGQGQHNDGWQLFEPVCLDNKCRSRLTAVALKRNKNNVAATTQPRSSQASAVARSQNSISVRPAAV